MNIYKITCKKLNNLFVAIHSYHNVHFHDISSYIKIGLMFYVFVRVSMADMYFGVTQNRQITSFTYTGKLSQY